jgi:hypothetical protein
MADVVLEVEVSVVDPYGATQPERHGRELLSESGDLLQTGVDHVDDVFVVGRRPLEDRRAPDVHVRVGALEVQKELVEHRESLIAAHRPPS